MVVRTAAGTQVPGTSISGEGAATQVEVTLGQLRPIRVYVIGEATRPGSYQLSSASTVLTALYAAGGPAETGSYREIRLVRGSRTIATLDLYDYLVRGERGGDHLLQEGDTVFIPNRLRRVHVTGPVRRKRARSTRSCTGACSGCGRRR